MIKAIKLFFIFSLILGGIVASFYIVNRNNTITIKGTTDATLEQYREQFEYEWEQVGDWDLDLFRKHCDMINQLTADSVYDVVILNDLNTSTAVEIVYKNIIKEWNNTSCSKIKIDNYTEAISVISKADFNAPSNPNVILIREIYGVYLKAYNLSLKKIGLTPYFDGNNWNSYSNYASSIESQKSNILNNNYYQKYLSNISEIKKGLDEIPSKLSSGRSHFYTLLANKIRGYYNDTPKFDRTRFELNKLRNTISKYEGEYGSNSSLSSFARTYADDVYENENNNR